METKSQSDNNTLNSLSELMETETDTENHHTAYEVVYRPNIFSELSHSSIGCLTSKKSAESRSASRD